MQKLLLAVLLLYATIISGQNIVFGTGQSQNLIDINGDLALGSTSLSIGNGLLNDVSTRTSFSSFIVTGPSVPFTIAGMTQRVEGKLISLYNNTDFIMSLANDAGSAAANARINTVTGLALVVPENASVMLEYLQSIARWVVRNNSAPCTWTLSVAEGPNGNIYVGNELGVYFKKSAAEPWMPFYTGLPKCPVNDMVVHLNSGKLRAATYGRGVWETELYSPCAAEITIAGEARGSYYYESSASITSTQLIAGGTGTTVHYKSAGNISLKEGMEVKHGAEGTYFKAYLGPCGTNISQLGTDSVVSQGIRLPEELNTGRYAPLKEAAYWRLQDGYLEYHLPEYAKISIEQIHPGGSTSSLLPEMLHAKGFFRIKTNEVSGEYIRVKINNILLQETEKQRLF